MPIPGILQPVDLPCFKTVFDPGLVEPRGGAHRCA